MPPPTADSVPVGGDRSAPVHRGAKPPGLRAAQRQALGFAAGHRDGGACSPSASPSGSSPTLPSRSPSLPKAIDPRADAISGAVDQYGRPSPPEPKPSAADEHERRHAQARSQLRLPHPAHQRAGACHHRRHLHQQAHAAEQVPREGRQPAHHRGVHWDEGARRLRPAPRARQTAGPRSERSNRLRGGEHGPDARLRRRGSAGPPQEPGEGAGHLPGAGGGRHLAGRRGRGGGHRPGPPSARAAGSGAAGDQRHPGHPARQAPRPRGGDPHPHLIRGRAEGVRGHPGGGLGLPGQAGGAGEDPLGHPRGDGGRHGARAHHRQAVLELLPVHSGQARARSRTTPGD